ncbi:probable bifunctional transcriptional activator/DNA repair enzyme AlkA [Arthrobacter sp. Hiyo4]|nr:probable bifunctional transcriptional activator/DNA repair enzyme AlkA [Arthrobacter sp. Hiyo4]
MSLPYREPFDPGIFSFLAVRAIPGIEAGTPTSYARTLQLPHGDARFSVAYDGGAPGRPLTLTIGAVDLRDLPALLSRVRRLFDLDADPVAIDSALSQEPRLSASVASAPGIRMPGALDPQELLIRAMIGQQITVAAARTALTQLAAAGSPSAVPARA